MRRALPMRADTFVTFLISMMFFYRFGATSANLNCGRYKFTSVASSRQLGRFVQLPLGERNVGDDYFAAMSAVIVVIAIYEHIISTGSHEIHPRPDFIWTSKAAVPLEIGHARLVVQF